jgi:sugar lactone lactonase YvrE
MTFQKLQRLLAVSFLALAVAACSGGDGGVSTPAPAPAPVATDISIIAGASGGGGYANGTGTAARFGTVFDLAYEANGNILVLDVGRLRRITPAGVVSDVAGGELAVSMAVGAGGSVVYSRGSSISSLSNSGMRTVLAGGAYTVADGLGAAAGISYATGLTLAADGTLYFIDGSTIRKLSPSGQVTTIAGRFNVNGNTDGVGSAASFNGPKGLALSKDGGLLYVSDTYNHRIRVINLSTNAVSNFAGGTSSVSNLANNNGACGDVEGSASNARFCNPYGIRMTPAGTLLVADLSNARIRAISAAGQVSTVAGATGGFIVGNPDGPAASAGFTYVTVLAVSPDGLTVAIGDQANPEVRLLKAGNVSGLAGSKPQDATLNGPGASARFNGPITAFTILPNGAMVAAQSGYLNPSERTFRRISATGSVSSDTGTTSFVTAMASNSVGDVYYATDFQLFKLSSGGLSTAIVGAVPVVGTIYDGSGFQRPDAMVAAADGTVYLAELGGGRIRKVTPAGVLSTLVADTNTPAPDGTGFLPSAVKTMVLDSRGDILIGSNFNIRKVTPAGVVTVVSNTVGCYGAATIDAANNLYCSQGDQTITRVSPAGAATVLLPAPADGNALFRTGSTTPSLNYINHLKLLSETATSLVFAVVSDNERVIVKATVAK